jgi:hypothetical protein
VRFRAFFRFLVADFHVVIFGGEIRGKESENKMVEI